MQGGYGGGYAAAPQVAPRKKHGIGMGGAALGLGGGLLGGMLSKSCNLQHPMTVDSIVC